MKKLMLVGLLAFGLNAGAQAAFTTGGYCSTSTATGGIATSNMSLNNQNANDCYGLVDIGGNVADEIDNINDLGWGTFSKINSIKDDTSGGITQTFLGMIWTLSAANGSNDSTYTLTVADADPSSAPEIPFRVDIIGFLKAGTPGAFYLFQDAVIDTSNGGTFKIVWTNNGGNNPGLSGLTLFIGEPGGGDPQVVPEPGSLALLGLALAGLGAMRRRFV